MAEHLHLRRGDIILCKVDGKSFIFHEGALESSNIVIHLECVGSAENEVTAQINFFLKSVVNRRTANPPGVLHRYYNINSIALSGCLNIMEAGAAVRQPAFDVNAYLRRIGFQYGDVDFVYGRRFYFYIKTLVDHVPLPIHDRPGYLPCLYGYFGPVRRYHLSQHLSRSVAVTSLAAFEFNDEQPPVAHGSGAADF